MVSYFFLPRRSTNLIYAFYELITRVILSVAGGLPVPFYGTTLRRNNWPYISLKQTIVTSLSIVGSVQINLINFGFYLVGRIINLRLVTLRIGRGGVTGDKARIRINASPRSKAKWKSGCSILLATLVLLSVFSPLFTWVAFHWHLKEHVVECQHERHHDDDCLLLIA